MFQWVSSETALKEGSPHLFTDRWGWESSSSGQPLWTDGVLISARGAVRAWDQSRCDCYHLVGRCRDTSSMPSSGPYRGWSFLPNVVEMQNFCSSSLDTTPEGRGEITLSALCEAEEPASHLVTPRPLAGQLLLPSRDDGMQKRKFQL